MPMNQLISESVKKRSLQQFKRLARKGRGVFQCKVYPVESGNSTILKRNVYHDVVEDTGPGKVNAFDSYCYFDFMPPLQTVKSLGWWKEGETLPMLAYFPVQEGVVFQKGVKFEVLTTDGIVKGMYDVLKEKSYGAGEVLLWVLSIAPYRKSSSVNL
jgi:hypothetical protein